MDLCRKRHSLVLALSMSIASVTQTVVTGTVVDKRTGLPANICSLPACTLPAPCGLEGHVRKAVPDPLEEKSRQDSPVGSPLGLCDQRQVDKRRADLLDGGLGSTGPCTAMKSQRNTRRPSVPHRTECLLIK
uniref:Secreted protein n=1 Tax=Molossus molossus TaxID=27622 RepID=A0A7J8FTU0_MOLMO|nr:hypothetical protein HJG59_008427 [Molossus molossus]